MKVRNMDRFRLLFCLATYLIAGTKAALDVERIVGGEIAPDDKYKYQISMQKNKINMCGGAIIGDKHVVTAAHCVTDGHGAFDSSMFDDIVVGALDLKSNSTVKRVGIEKVYIPNEYNSSSHIADIAVLKLNQSLNLDGNNQLDKVKLPEPTESYVGKNATITGFGYTTMINNSSYKYNEKGGYDTYKKKFGTALVLSNDECARMWNRTSIPGKRLCAKMYQPSGNETAGVCSGDSGGPLVYGDNIIIGVLSTSPTLCTEKMSPAIYTRVSEYLNFIKDAMGDRVKGYKYPSSNETVLSQLITQIMKGVGSAFSSFIP